jgi:hypothetical protein
MNTTLISYLVLFGVGFLLLRTVGFLLLGIIGFVYYTLNQPTLPLRNWLRNQLNAWRIHRLQQQRNLALAALDHHRSAAQNALNIINTTTLKLARLKPEQLGDHALPRIQKRADFTVITPAAMQQLSRL